MSEFYNRRLGRWFVSGGGRSQYRYRYRMERHLGRPLTEDEHVHHINGDRTDDRIENLQIVSNAEHNCIHRRDREEAVAAKRLYDWSPNHPACIECGTVKRRHTGHGECSRCYFRSISRRKRGGKPRKYGRTITERICKICGQPFSREAWREQDYCSRACSKRASWIRRKTQAA